MQGQVKTRGERPANRWRIPMWSAFAVLLLIPAVAMRFTSEVRWTAFDFAFAAVLLSLVGGAYELATLRTANAAYRAGVGIAVTTTFLLIWINGAVGIFGDEGPQNLLFGGVLLVALVGALVARFRPRGMALAMAAAAGVQILAAAIGLVTGWGVPFEALLAAGFALPWAASAGLFLKAAGPSSPSDRDRL